MEDELDGLSGAGWPIGRAPRDGNGWGVVTGRGVRLEADGESAPTLGQPRDRRRRSTLGGSFDDLEVQPWCNPTLTGRVADRLGASGIDPNAVTISGLVLDPSYGPETPAAFRSRQELRSRHRDAGRVPVHAGCSRRGVAHGQGPCGKQGSGPQRTRTAASGTCSSRPARARPRTPVSRPRSICRRSWVATG